MDYLLGADDINQDELNNRLDARDAAKQKDADIDEAIQLQTQAIEQQQQVQEQEDNKNSVGEEIGNAVVGGLSDAAQDVLSLPERIVDMTNGEMEEQGEDYKPDWGLSNFIDGDRFETQTWWGGLIRGTTNLATLLIPIGGVFKSVGWLAKLPTIAKGAAIGASVDLITAQSQGDNLSGMIVEHFPVMDNILGPLATKESDHPLMKTLKNVVEGMGIGGVIDVLLLTRAMGKTGDELAEALGKAADEVDARNADVAAQTIEKGKIEMEDPGFRGHKNKPIAEPQQGSPNSRGKPLDVEKQLYEIETKWDAEKGSADSLITPTQAERIKIGGDKESAKVIRKVAKEILSDERYEALVKDAKSKKTTLSTRFRDSLLKAHEALLPRNRDVNAQQYWDQIFPEEYQARTGKRTYLNEDGVAVPVGDDFDINYIPPEEVLAADLIVGSLTKQLRDLAQASGQMLSFRELMDGDGPMKTIADRIVTGLGMARRSRYLSGLQLQKLAGPSGKEARKKVLQTLDEMHAETTQAMDMVYGMIRKDDDQKFINAWIETLTNAKDVNSLEDLDKFMRKVMKGGEIKGKTQTGMMIRELQGVMINSILSGPKTPVKALSGTAFNSTLRYISQALGAAIRAPFTGDTATMKSSIASITAMVDSVPEAFKVFKSRFQANWSGDAPSIASRFMEYQRRNEDFTRLERWVETRGTAGDKAAFRMTSLARNLNQNPVLTLSNNLMNATDAAFDVVMGRARAKEKAIREVLDMQETVNIPFQKDKELMRSIEDRYFKDLYDEDGLYNDEFLKAAAAESKLNADLTGFAKGLDDAFNKAPLLKPFYLFARTGVNGIAMTSKYTPILNFALKKQRDILTASADNLENVIQYGIKNAEDLANEKALMLGRQTLGTTVTFVAAHAYLGDRLRGNGPEDRQLRQSWIDAGWTPRSVKVGDVWVSLDAFEPFNSMLYAVADIGDNMQLMGPEWAEQHWARVAAGATIGMVSKSYMEGLIQVVDLFQGEPNQLQKILGSLMNNQVPLAGLRNEIGKLFYPGMNEINNGIRESIRNRNGITETIGLDGGLPKKYDLLTGEPLRDYHPITRLFNAISPIQFNLDHGSPGRDMLFNSNYDTRMSVLSSPDGISLADNPIVRSLYQQAIGNLKLEQKLDEIARRPEVIASLQKMHEDLRKGKRDIDPKDYLHNRLIKQEFDRARKLAWQQISNNPAVRTLINEQRDRDLQQIGVQRDTSAVQDILSIHR